MTAQQTTPHISHLSWGQVEVEQDGSSASFKDVKIWPNGAREWDWNEVGALLHSTC